MANNPKIYFLIQKDNDACGIFVLSDNNHASQMIKKIQNTEINRQSKNQIIDMLEDFMQTQTDISRIININEYNEYDTINKIYEESYKKN